MRNDFLTLALLHVLLVLLLEARPRGVHSHNKHPDLPFLLDGRKLCCRHSLLIKADFNNKCQPYFICVLSLC